MGERGARPETNYKAGHVVDKEEHKRRGKGERTLNNK